ncbi:putative methyltransferase [Peziza echinospora]|nr:putative methyltransferase [Peziza echinospora]
MVIFRLPNDDKEQDRLDLMHHIFRMILNKKLHAAPLHNPERILDLGTGTGIWAIEMADEYPDAQIIANDLSAIQPKKVPPNVTFEVDDCESLWPYSKPFDFVHARTLTGAIQDWPALYKQAFANLKPGGWMEATDRRVPFNHYSCVITNHKHSTLFHRAVEMVGRMPDVAQLHKGMMIDAGFVNVQERIIHIPQNTWPEDKNQKVLGAYLMYSIIDAIPSYGIAALTRILGMPRVEAEVLIAAAKNEVQDTRNRFYSIAHIVIGQRPEENTGHGF